MTSRAWLQHPEGGSGGSGGAKAVMRCHQERGRPTDRKVLQATGLVTNPVSCRVSQLGNCELGILWARRLPGEVGIRRRTPKVKFHLFSISLNCQVRFAAAPLIKHIYTHLPAIPRRPPLLTSYYFWGLFPVLVLLVSSHIHFPAVLRQLAGRQG